VATRQAGTHLRFPRAPLRCETRGARVRYYPAGYVGTERAIFMIAAAKDPELWSRDAIPPEERLVWERMNVTWNGLVLNQHLPYSIPPGQRDGAIDRLCSFYRALDLLRKALHLGSITAEFCDERGRFDYIQKDGWGGEAGLDILLSGVAELDYGATTWTRLLLLPEQSIHEFISDTESFLSRSSAPEPRESAKIAPLHESDRATNATSAVAQTSNALGFGTRATPDAVQMSRTGAAGRPSAKHLVLNELNRRARDGEIPSNASIKQIAHELADWYEAGPRKQEPNLPPLTSETIRKSLRAEIRRAMGEMPGRKLNNG
jgi:hypothetical protein